MWDLPPRPHSITSPPNTRPARSATSRSTARIPARSFLHLEERRETHMTNKRQGRKPTMKLFHCFGSSFLLLVLTLGCLGVSRARAQQAPDPKGIDEGN